MCLHFKKSETLSLESFRKMDLLAVTKFKLPIELMMENAGLQLAKLIAQYAATNKDALILIGVGNGNNGGGGLVAARRLAAWGFKVFLDIATEITKELPKIQLERALLFGVKINSIIDPDIWVDAYLGFSQRLPLNSVYMKKIEMANTSSALRISLDIPTGISSSLSNPMFKAHKVVTLAAPKNLLNNLPIETDIYIADLGIPKEVYTAFNIPMPAFFENQLICINKKQYR